ncbi:thiol-disulfide oxidoreductase [Novosphingobium kaempferiae]|uniref:thiol-disulfide oxidoreductase n=1 Tax=Novosphingobium kaempferiae TaxID=2896849 RepID=UPI001E45A951|nr:thiol-disulfide oxidoreductase [Novosphingobium kaempferiae]
MPAFDGLTAVAPCWGVAALFSIVGDPWGLIGREGALYMLLAWSVVGTSAVTILFPRKTWALVALAACTVLLYAMRLPVASNNKTITTVFDLCILLSAAVLASKGSLDRQSLYESLRTPARLILATMYFYGIFHKINTDFLDPTVSCAVGLYKPLAEPFGLEDNLFGRYLAIWSTFVIEGIAIVALFWKRWFAIGLTSALVFHYIIPISAYSWYMDFSSLVFALYMLTMPREASAKIYEITCRHLVEPLRSLFGRVGILAPAAGLLLAATLVVLLLALANPGRPALMLLHSIFILTWAVVGGVAMTAMIYAAMVYLPYRGGSSGRSPYAAWNWIVPTLFFVSCLSPYVGLKTESSINMFSNLHTEGGTTNHLMFSRPPYLFDYQQEVVQVVASSSPSLSKTAREGRMNVLFSIEEYLRRHPDQWVSYIHDGQLIENATAATLPVEAAWWLERKLLIFKQVDPARPKVCTH